jgi:glycosyltransferase involved in cell wall biosynthesis
MTELRRSAADLPVELIGELPHRQALDQVSRAGIFVFPATGGDGMPNAVLEAMALGLAIIATPVAGIPDIVRDGENGLVVPVGDSVALADAVTRLVEDSQLRQRLGECARLTADGLSWTRLRRRLLDEIDVAMAAFDTRRRRSSGRIDGIGHRRRSGDPWAQALADRETIPADRERAPRAITV